MKKMKLLPWVMFHHDLRLMVFRPTGIVDEAHVDKTVAMLQAAEEQADKPFNRYTDLSRLDAIDLSFKYIFRVSLHRRLAYAKYPPVKSAFYCTSSAAARVARIHVMLTEYSPLKVRMFKELDAAAKWLGVSVETLEIQA
jgi:hypothetical protein